MIYIVEITETLQKQIYVDADNRDIALYDVRQKYSNGEIVLVPENIIDTNIEVLSNNF